MSKVKQGPSKGVWVSAVTLAALMSGGSALAQMNQALPATAAPANQILVAGNTVTVQSTQGQ